MKASTPKNTGTKDEGEHSEEHLRSNHPPSLAASSDAFLERVREAMENFEKERLDR